MVGIGGMTGVLFSISHIVYVNYLPFIMAAFLLAGLLAMSRMIAGQHTTIQLYTGFAAGFAAEYIALHYYLF